MTTIQARVKRWGNSFAVIIPSETMETDHIKENDNISLIIVKDSRKVFEETFGSLKGKLKRSSQEMKDELRRDLY